MLNIIGFSGFDDNKLWQTARRIHAMKYKLKLDNEFKFDDLKLPQKLTSVMTSNGKIT